MGVIYSPVLRTFFSVPFLTVLVEGHVDTWCKGCTAVKVFCLMVLFTAFNPLTADDGQVRH